MIKIIVTPKTIMAHNTDTGDSVLVPALKDSYKKIIQVLKSKKANAKEEAWEIAVNCNVKKSITTKTSRITFEKNTAFIDGNKIENALSNKLIWMAENGYDPNPILKFYDNCKLNPNAESVKDLYTFIEMNKLPLTADGCILAYKKVCSTGDGKTFTSSHDKKTKYIIGKDTKMKRDLCDHDRNSHCSTGLHVGAWDYVKSFSGDTMILMRINPKDWVSTPTDYNCQKARCCCIHTVCVYDATTPIEQEYIKVSKFKKKK